MKCHVCGNVDAKSINELANHYKEGHDKSVSAPKPRKKNKDAEIEDEMALSQWKRDKDDEPEVGTPARPKSRYENDFVFEVTSDEDANILDESDVDKDLYGAEITDTDGSSSESESDGYSSSDEYSSLSENELLVPPSRLAKRKSAQMKLESPKKTGNLPPGLGSFLSPISKKVFRQVKISDCTAQTIEAMKNLQTPIIKLTKVRADGHDNNHTFQS